jgi:subtilisin family serine protease
VDDGIDASHPDLIDNVRRDLSISVVPGHDWDDPDLAQHGTGVASIVAAADNGVGIVGVAPEAQLIAVKATVEPSESPFIDPATQISWVINGVLYAASVGADAINLSLGLLLPANGGCDIATGVVCFGRDDVRAVTRLADRVVQYAWRQGSLVVVAAGNEGVDRDANPGLVHLPADSHHALSVAATSPHGWGGDPSTDLHVPTSYTNTGMPEIDLSAPGGDIDAELFLNPGQSCTVDGFTRPCFFFDAVHVAWPGEMWIWDLGTSFAAPHVAGVIGLVAGRHPEYGADRLRSAVVTTADDVGPAGRDAAHGFGAINAYRAVS